ncbi:unnamed protein product, partial [marine sediment metagenome]
MASGRQDYLMGVVPVTIVGGEVQTPVFEGKIKGWVDEDIGWKNLLCNEEGKLIIDPTEILEDVPLDGHLSHAPTANWAHDHAALENAHHDKFTPAEARAAINDIIDSEGKIA